jgi:hypothetical protein
LVSLITKTKLGLSTGRSSRWRACGKACTLLRLVGPAGCTSPRRWRCLAHGRHGPGRSSHLHGGGTKHSGAASRVHAQLATATIGLRSPSGAPSRRQCLNLWRQRPQVHARQRRPIARMAQASSDDQV